MMSKTSRGYLDSEIHPDRMLVTHRWTPPMDDEVLGYRDTAYSAMAKNAACGRPRITIRAIENVQRPNWFLGHSQ
jgi:hypothetical protein